MLFSSVRCKLYYKKDDQWIDRGVGNLHLKPVPENKTQILVRADTNLGKTRVSAASLLPPMNEFFVFIDVTVNFHLLIDNHFYSEFFICLLISIFTVNSLCIY